LEQDTCASPSGRVSRSARAGLHDHGFLYSAGRLPLDSVPLWRQSGGHHGIAPEYCPFPLGATLTVVSPSSADGETSFAVPITGLGLSALQPSTPELDFGAEEQFSPAEASLPQALSFTNNSPNPVQILGSAACVNPPKGRSRFRTPCWQPAGLGPASGRHSPGRNEFHYSRQ